MQGYLIAYHSGTRQERTAAPTWISDETESAFISLRYVGILHQAKLLWISTSSLLGFLNLSSCFCLQNCWPPLPQFASLFFLMVIQISPPKIYIYVKLGSGRKVPAATYDCVSQLQDCTNIWQMCQLRGLLTWAPSAGGIRKLH